MTLYRGTPIDSVEFNRKADLYTLICEGEIVAELKRHEYLSQPQLRTIRLSNGKHRRPRAAFRGGSSRQPYFTLPPGAGLYSSAGTAWWSFGDPRPAKPIEDAGIRAGEVIAQRCWRVRDDRLFSAFKREHEWMPGVPMRGDVRRDYGVHAFKSKEHLAHYILECKISDSVDWVMMDYVSGEIRPRTVSPSVFAIGTIALWGEIVEHEFGYRAEFGKISSINRVSGAKDDLGLIERLHTRYGVSAFAPAEREGAPK